jgi:hypothetical protein
MEKNKMNRKILTLTLILGLLTATALAVYAETATVVISGGSLSFSPANITLSGVTLDGTDQTSTSAYTANTWTAVDGRGTGAGWNVTIDSTDFSDGGTKSIDISTAGSEFKIQLTNITVTAGSAAPTSSVTSLTTIPTNPAAALKFLSAANDGTAMGTYSVEPNFELGILAETYVGTGTYTATVVVTAASGP